MAFAADPLPHPVGVPLANSAILPNDRAMEPAQKLRRQRTRSALIVVTVLVVIAVFVVLLSRERLFPKRFAVVEPGQLYRGGYTEPWPLERVIRQYGIRHILCLMNLTPDDPRLFKEEKVASETGVVLKEIPMPGNGCADFASLDAAADYIANPADRPLFVHCAAGVQRTGAAIAAYRLKHGGWSYAQAIAEAEKYGLNRHDNPKLYDHLKRYSEHLAELATRPAATSMRTSPEPVRAATSAPAILVGGGAR
jgi:protein tyrosine phosphatase (PTP) superfamily phosphohydrolase (DUF442 family)